MTNFCFEPYLFVPTYFRIPLAKLRISCHPLNIEAGTYHLPSPIPSNYRDDEPKTSEVLTVCLLAACTYSLWISYINKQMGKRKKFPPPGFEPKATSFAIRCHTQYHPGKIDIFVFIYLHLLKVCQQHVHYTASRSPK